MKKAIFKILRYLLRMLRTLKSNLIGYIYLIVYKKLSIEYPFKLNGLPYFRISGRASIGRFCTFNSSTIYNTAGITKACSIYVGRNSILIIGENCGFSGVSIHSEVGIRIGNNCMVGANSCIWDTDFHSLNYLDRRIHGIENFENAPIDIGNDVFIGAHCLVLKGVTIGDRAVIGAGSIVVKNVPSDQVWAGNPARFIRSL